MAAAVTTDKAKAALDLVGDETAALEQIDKARDRQRQARDKAILEAVAIDGTKVTQVALAAGLSRGQVHRIMAEAEPVGPAADVVAG